MNMNMNHIPLRKTQRGTVLVISLLLLVIMTMIGVTAMKTTTLDEQLAGNMRDRSLAFQAAESALRDGEVMMDDKLLDELRSFDGTDGLYYKGLNFPADVADSTVWVGTSSTEYSGDPLDDIATTPRYIADVVIDRGNLDMDLIADGAWDYAVIQLTSRGTGGSNQSQALLRTHFGKLY